MRFKEFLTEASTQIGYHYSSEALKPGDVLKGTTSAANYDLVWGIYKAVTEEQGKYWPHEFGYAYPNKRFDRACFAVEAPKSKVTAGNWNHSLHVTLDRLREFTDRNLPLKERLEKRNERIKEEALKYFKADDSIELISDSWTVK